MKSMAAAWLTAIGIYTWDHAFHTTTRYPTGATKPTVDVGGKPQTVNYMPIVPPQPRNLVLGSLIFAALAVVSEVSDGGSKVASIFGWGVDFAYAMKVAQNVSSFNTEKSQGKNPVWPRTPTFGAGGQSWPPSLTPNDTILPNRKGTAPAGTGVPTSTTGSTPPTQTGGTLTA